MELIAEGAEAKIYKLADGILKERVEKSYRLPEIDLKLRKYRTRAEASILQKLKRSGVNVPNVISSEGNKLKIDFISGEKLRDILTPDLCLEVGKITKLMHDADVAHGDLTTSNMIFHSNYVWLIDFGLSSVSSKLEDKAVDLHIFKECLVSKHHSIWEDCWEKFVRGYADEVVLKRLEKVERRGRYKGQ